jgi:hypothetical protein
VSAAHAGLVEAEDIFARHLDLEPLGGRRRGRVRCIFHNERTPSLSVDLDRGLFHCFGCGTQGGVAKFAELVGEQAPPSKRDQAVRWESPLDRARREILAEARRQPWYREDIRLLYQISDAIRARHRAVRVAREIAVRAGDRPEAWNLLALAAVVELEAHRIETQLDEVLA